MLCFIFALVALLVATTFAQDFDTYRLPNNTRPETYDISIRSWIDENNFTFTGSVRIGIVAVESTNFIRLHHDVREVQSVSVQSADEVSIAIGDHSYNAEYDFFTIPIVGSNLTQGTRYFVDIDYVGVMNAYDGFYQSGYNVNGVWVRFGSTQFEATYARSAFPCYDEPQLKSNFTIRITHVSNYSAVSNMPAVSVTQNSDGSATTLFQTTPLMSTYLVAFHVSNFPHATSSSPGSIPQRMFTRSTYIGSANEPLEIGELLLDALIDFVEIEFPLPKIDQIAVPGFPYPNTGMENWGMVTYSEPYALQNASSSYYLRLQSIQTISHEIAHQYFGNLVTPSWWTYLWMKEGFATFFEFFGVNLIFPEWQMLDYFVVDINRFAFIIDSYESSLPMTHYVEHPYDIGYQFRSIAYMKAAAVIRMFWYMFGEEAFKDGVISYLRNNAFANAVEEDLFDAIALHVRMNPEIILPPTGNVSEIMASWTQKAGYPLITVVRNYDDRTDRVTLTQQRFYENTGQNPVNTTWWVPYNFATPSNPGFANTRAEGWIPNVPSFETTVNSLGADDYLLLNKQAVGFYRVLYDERNYVLIADAILKNRSLFHSTNIAQLIDDAYIFYVTNRLPVTPVLSLLRVLEFRSDLVSWSSAFGFINFVDGIIEGHRSYPIWADFIRSLTEEFYDSVGIEDIPNEPILYKFSRPLIIHLACQMGSVHCRSDANRELRRHLEGFGETFHRDLRYTLRCASMKSATRNDFHSVWNSLHTLPIGDFGRSDIIRMLSCSTSRTLLNEFVRSAYNSTMYSQYESSSVVDAVMRNGGNTGIAVALEFFIDNAEETVAFFGSWFVGTLTPFIRNAERIERFFVLQNILIDANLMDEEAALQNLDTIEFWNRYYSQYSEPVSAWLEENFV